MSTMSWIRRPADYGARPVELPEPQRAELDELTQRSTGPSSTTRGLFQYHTQNPIAVNPVLEQPQLDWRSLRQPITVQGWRRWVRTGMHASMPFQGRVYAAGKMWNQFLNRERITGPAALSGVTYQYDPLKYGPPPSRIISLRGRGAEGGPNSYVDRQGRTTPPAQSQERQERPRGRRRR